MMRNISDHLSLTFNISLHFIAQNYTFYQINILKVTLHEEICQDEPSEHSLPKARAMRNLLNFLFLQMKQICMSEVIYLRPWLTCGTLVSAINLAFIQLNLFNIHYFIHLFIQQTLTDINNIRYQTPSYNPLLLFDNTVSKMQM